MTLRTLPLLLGLALLLACALAPGRGDSCAFSPGRVPSDTASLVRGYLEDLWLRPGPLAPQAYAASSLRIHGAQGGDALGREDLIAGARLLREAFPGVGRGVMGMVIEGEQATAWTQVVMGQERSSEGVALEHQITLAGGKIIQEEIKEVPMGQVRQVTRGGISFRWRFEGGELVGEVSAKTRGWVLVGFNTKPGLRGARLIMGGVRGGEPWGEEHVADPPRHQPVGELGIRGGLRVLGATETPEGVTTLRFRLKGEVKGVSCGEGETLHVILAESVSDDAQHHSRTRVSVDLML